jgi:hypothetical protein
MKLDLPASLDQESLYCESTHDYTVCSFMCTECDVPVAVVRRLSYDFNEATQWCNYGVRWRSSSA